MAERTEIEGQTPIPEEPAGEGVDVLSGELQAQRLASRLGLEYVDLEHFEIDPELFRSIPVDGFVHVKGRTENYKGNLQFIIDGLRLQQPVSQPFVTLTQAVRNALLHAGLDFIKRSQDRRAILVPVHDLSQQLRPYQVQSIDSSHKGIGYIVALGHTFPFRVRQRCQGH